MNLLEQMTQLAKHAKTASRELAKLTTAEKNSCLLAMAEALEKNSASLQEANALDMDTGAKMGLSSAMLDRLGLMRVQIRDATRDQCAGQPVVQRGRKGRVAGDCCRDASKGRDMKVGGVRALRRPPRCQPFERRIQSHVAARSRCQRTRFNGNGPGHGDR